VLLARATDPAKDQSYMLARLDPRVLDRIWFPLGEQTKEETRAQARAAGLAVASRGESQEACFLAGGDYRDFLARHGLNGSGSIVDEEGRELGTHEGVWRFTPGQRRGLGVAGREPLYALETRPSTQTVVVGPRSSLARTRVSVRGRLFVPVESAEAKLRYRSPGVAADVEPASRGFRLALREPAFAVAAGQAAVLYEDDVVVGSGIITSASAA
jgi:tRNA-specific 2-thiouridylase